MVLYIQIKGNNLIDKNNQNKKSKQEITKTKTTKKQLPFKIILRKIRKNQKGKEKDDEPQ